ncbi:MAG: RDD family protein [Prevotella sp.]|jgi:uncharacterized RDD family membrane protein YckC|nr:RDD family protein [Prevotella sp.]MBR6137961.1 RDD family protein [Prevotella sp.]MDO4980047.1 RDD family protein [Prevotellaceae bacterium]
MSQTNIITGQYVRISQAPASLAARIGAWGIDIIAIMIYFTGITYLITKISPDFDSPVLLFIFILGVYLPTYAYPLLCEVFFNGQSLGKRILKIRVVKKDGSVPTLGDYVMRWLLFIVDGPTMGCLGIVFILLSKNSQRLGDMAAGTMVIKTNNFARNRVLLSEFGYVSKNYKPFFPQAADLTYKQAEVIQRCLLSEERQRVMRISRLSQKVRNTLGVSQMNMSDEHFLQAVLHDFQYYAIYEV